MSDYEEYEGYWSDTTDADEAVATDRARIRRELIAEATAWKEMPGTLESEGYRWAMAARLLAAIDRILPQSDKGVK